MKLIECYISSFGKLKDYKLSFDNNLTVINRENAYGKTTLSIFIKSMFYGLDEAKRDVDNNERKKYKPWNSTEKFGGYLIFEKDGVNYKIERFFGNKESEDTGLLTDLSTGKTFDNYLGLGERLFEIDQGGFLSTTFFSQKDFTVKSNSSLTAKFNTVCDVQDTLAFDKAVSKIKDLAKGYKYSGDRGHIPQAKRDLLEVEKEIQIAEQSLSSVNEYKQQALDLNEQLNACQQEIKELSDALSLSAKVEAYNDTKALYEKLMREQNQLAHKIEDANKTLNGNNVTQKEIESCKECVEQLNKSKQQKSFLEKDLLDLENEKNQSNASNTNNKKLLILGACGIGVIAGIILMIFSLIPGIVLTVLSVFFFALSLFYKKDKKEQSPLLILLEKKKNQIQELNNVINGYNNSLSMFFSRFNLLSFDFSTMIEEVENAVKTKEESKKSFNENLLEIEKLSFNPQETANENIPDYNQTKQKLFEKNEQLKSLSNSLAKINSAISEREAEANNLPSLENKKSALIEKTCQLKDELDILNLTYDFLQKADENLKVRYRAPMQTAFDKYVGLLSGVEMDVEMDVDFNITINERGLSLPTDYYSKGYKNLFDICKRFALIEVLFNKEKPFVILDDPFCNLDDEKITFAKSLLEQLSKEYQIIYFTCHNSRAM
ncbi:MAG: hypothetical protein IKB98_00865 [Clostridia bacterium]|nr:hypothetical protein [Clostridia bacterium]